MELNIKSTITIVMTFVIGVILIVGVLVPIIADNSGSGGGSGTTYTNSGLPMKSITDFRNADGNYAYIITNCNITENPQHPGDTLYTPTENVHLYEYRSLGQVVPTEIGTIQNNTTAQHIITPLIVSEDITMMWELDNDTSPQGNSILIYNSDDPSDMAFTLMYGTSTAGSFSIMIWYEDNEIKCQFYTAPASADSPVDLTISLDAGYVYYPNGSYVWTDATENGTTIHWADKGLAMMYDQHAIYVVDLPTMQTAWTMDDGTEYGLAYLFNDPDVGISNYSDGVTTSDGVSTVNAKLTVDYENKTDGIGMTVTYPGEDPSYENMYTYILPATISSGSGGDSGSGTSGPATAMLYLIPILLIAGMIILGINMVLKRN